MKIIWFHDASEYYLSEDIQITMRKYFLLNTIILHTDLIHFYLEIQQITNKENLILIVSGPSARQIISLVIEISSIHYIFLIEYQLQSIQPTKQHLHPPSDKFKHEKCFFLTSTRPPYNEIIFINRWIVENATLSLLDVITGCISIGGILTILTEILACTSWYIILAPLIKQMHQKCLIQTIRNNIFNYYLLLFEIVLKCHLIEWDMSQCGYKILAQFYILRFENHRLFRTYSKLIDGYCKKNQINDIYYRTNLAYKFSKRSETIFQTLALYLYNETLDKVKVAEKIDYIKNGCIYGSIAFIFLQRGQRGMAIHNLNQILNEYIRYNQNPPLDVYLSRICIQIGLWKLTKSQQYLQNSLNDLKEINELILNNDTSKNEVLFNMCLIYMELRRFTFAVDCLDRILQENNLELDQLIEIYCVRGQIFLELKELDIALDSYKKSLQLCNSTNKKQFVSINIAIGVIYEKKEEWNTALEYFIQALNIIEEHHQESTSFLGSYPASEIIYRHLSNIYEQIHEMNLAENHQKKAILESIRLFQLGFQMKWSNDICGYNIYCDLQQMIIAKDYIIPDELLLE